MASRVYDTFIFHENWVCVVDMRVNLPARGRLAQEFKTAVKDRQMIHLSSTARARSCGFKFIVTPECAVEQNQIGANRRFGQFMGELSNRWRD